MLPSVVITTTVVVTWTLSLSDVETSCLEVDVSLLELVCWDEESDVGVEETDELV